MKALVITMIVCLSLFLLCGIALLAVAHGWRTGVGISLVVLGIGLITWAIDLLLWRDW